MRTNRFDFVAAVIAASLLSLPAHASREPVEVHHCPPMISLWSKPAPAALPYEYILDRPIDWQREVPQADELLRRILSASSDHWRAPAGGPGSLDHQSHILRMAAHWVRRVRGYLVARDDWGFAERAEALEHFCKIIHDRTRMPPGVRTLWRLATYRSKEGDLVVTGEKHRIVLLNRPSAPLVAGQIPFRERAWIERAGGPERYYRNWRARDLEGSDLQPVSKEIFWDDLLNN